MFLKISFIHMLILSMNLLSLAIHQRQHLQISWNSSNPIFQSFAFITVYLGDSIDFLCPFYTNDTHSFEYNTLYLVSEQDYYSCNTTTYHPLIKCNKPFESQPLIYTLSISKYLPYPNLPEFVDGQFYYFISTSTGHIDGVDQHFHGLCLMKNMKLILNVQRHSRYYKLTPNIAKRTNFTYVHFHQRYFSLSSTIIPIRNRFLIVFFLCFLFAIKKRMMICV